MNAVTGCEGCSTSAGVHGCPTHHPNYPGVGMALHVALWQACAEGNHAWTPWLALPNGSFVTVCGRDGCNAERQYDQ